MINKIDHVKLLGSLNILGYDERFVHFLVYLQGNIFCFWVKAIIKGDIFELQNLLGVSQFLFGLSQESFIRLFGIVKEKLGLAKNLG